MGSARSYQAQEQRAEALAELDLAKTTFFSSVSHEFRTPLTLILGPVSELLGRASGVDEQARQELELVQRNGLRLAKLVNTLLDFSRIHAGRMQAHFEPADLPALTAELASVFRSAIDRAGLTFTVDCPPLDRPVVRRPRDVGEGDAQPALQRIEIHLRRLDHRLGRSRRHGRRRRRHRYRNRNTGRRCPDSSNASIA